MRGFPNRNRADLPASFFLNDGDVRPLVYHDLLRRYSAGQRTAFTSWPRDHGRVLDDSGVVNNHSPRSDRLMEPSGFNENKTRPGHDNSVRRARSPSAVTTAETPFHPGRRPLNPGHPNPAVGGFVDP